MLPTFKDAISFLPKLSFSRELEGFEGPFLSEYRAVYGDGIFLEKYCTEHEGVRRWLIVRTERRALKAYLDKQLPLDYLLTVTSGGLGFIVDRKGDEEVARYLVALSELPEGYLCKVNVFHDETLRPDRLEATWKPRLLEAVSREDYDAAFNIIFDLVSESKVWGEVEPIDDMLGWMASEGVAASLAIDVHLAVLRVPSMMSAHLKNWNAALRAVRDVLIARKQDDGALLCGLTETLN